MAELEPCVHEALNSIPSTDEREEKNEMKEKDSRPQNMIAFYLLCHEVARSLAMLPATDEQGPSNPPGRQQDAHGAVGGFGVAGPPRGAQQSRGQNQSPVSDATSMVLMNS